MIDIKPSDEVVESVMSNRIDIAYLAIRNEEHYEATASVQKQQHSKMSELELDSEHQRSIHTTPQKTTGNEERNETSINSQSTPHKRADYQSPVKNRPAERKKEMNQIGNETSERP